mmetsp:Transcript_15938/g.20826  ORF Transcript_15938/g.20826 Transcript_15938/m.20826 type:complete len:233 (+) Transcript_15938:202-900(+)|eukprot:CAMPEP_0198145662 /NCGR_PEP_ID=MMETSP1443-20131203/24831_1 /TAXON_ID=186043 /ORGANISM="Entomoneis sp., Strain CCMP2396" /LENGTH=232 /DNA_ID=CAMNT_0043809363 /DNA_START=173 /DNA_END=871 /DNA_ORIENTATION=-
MFGSASVLVLLMTSVSSEMYKIHNAFGDGEIESFNDAGGLVDSRRLQLDVGNLASMNATSDTCSLIGAGINCRIDSLITANDGSSAEVAIVVECPLESQVGFDFRRAVGCSCGARVTPSNGVSKDCPCIVCPFGFGTAPISVDCTMREDPYIISTCTFMDCGFSCNGTCEFDCSNSGPSCTFCAPGAPTPAPTGLDGSTRPPTTINRGSSGERASAFARTSLLFVLALYFAL